MKELKWERPYMQSIETERRDEWADELAQSSDHMTAIRSGDRIVLRWGSEIFDCLITGRTTTDEVLKAKSEV